MINLQRGVETYLVEFLPQVFCLEQQRSVVYSGVKGVFTFTINFCKADFLTDLTAVNPFDPPWRFLMWCRLWNLYHYWKYYISLKVSNNITFYIILSYLFLHNSQFFRFSLIHKIGVHDVAIGMRIHIHS